MTAPPPPAHLALRLHSSEDPNGNSFSVSSCSSSASSSSCSSSPLGEASPDSLSSPSDGGWGDARLEVTVATAAHGPQQEGVAAEVLPDDASLSVYLDARSGHTWSDHNHNLLLPVAVETLPGGRHGDDAGDDLSGGRGCSSEASDATEIPADDDDDDVEACEEESLFLSVSSELSLETSSTTQPSPPSVSPTILGVSCCSLTPTTPSSSSSSSSSSTNQLAGSRLSDAEVCEVCLKTDSHQDQPRPPKALVSTATKPANQDARRVRRPDLKNIKAKVVSRPTPSASKLSNQRQSAPANQRRIVTRKEKVQVSEEKCQRSTTGGVQTRSSPCRSIQSEERKSLASRSDLGSEVTEMAPVANGITKTTLDTPLRQKVSSKPGLGARQQAGRRALGASSAAGPRAVWGSGAPGQGGSGPRPAHAESSSLGKEAGSGEGGAPPRARLSHNQGIPKPRPSAERSSSLATQYSVTTNSKAALANQLAGPLPWGRSTATPPSSGSKLPVKGLPRTLSSSSLGSSPAENNREGTPADEEPSPGAPPVGSQSSSTTVSTDANPASIRVPGTRSRALSLQNRTSTTGLKPPAITGPSPTRPTNHATSNQKAAVSANQALPSKPSQNPLQRSGSARFNRPTSTMSPVDKNKPRVARPTQPGSSLSQQPPAERQAPDLLNGNGPPSLPALPPEDGSPPSTPSSGTNPPCTIQGFGVRSGPRSSRTPRPAGGSGSGPQPGGGGRRVEEKRSYSKERVEETRLRTLLVQENRRVEALATVIQHLLSERELMLKQKQDLSHQLNNLKDELASSMQSCQRLQKEKGEVLSGQQEVLRSTEQQHKEELAQLEDRLRSFYQAEWDKVHQRYQEEADRYRTLMEQQVEELRSRQEAELRKQEVTYSQETKSLTQRFESSVEDLQNSHQQSLEQLDRRLQQTEASLSERVSVLLLEKEELQEKLRAEEEAMRRSLTEPRFLYLQQELDSLKVVLEMKTSQLHLKDKKLMEMEKLVDTNVKLEECLNRVQQENEDYRARMNKHAALSKQLTSEQALLQQNLQKESKVNKRLSMENEELLWKLHHGDPLGSPRRLSPTSPCHSPQNSPSFPTVPPLSPR